MVSFNTGNMEKVTLCAVWDDTQENYEYLPSARLGAGSILCLNIEALEVCRRQEAHGLCLRNYPGGL